MSLFTDDGTFRVEGLEVEASSRGHAQLRKVYEKALDELDPRLFIHSQIVDLAWRETARPADATSSCSAPSTAWSGSAWVTTRTSTQKLVRSGSSPRDATSSTVSTRRYR